MSGGAENEERPFLPRQTPPSSSTGAWSALRKIYSSSGEDRNRLQTIDEASHSRDDSGDGPDGSFKVVTAVLGRARALCVAQSGVSVGAILLTLALAGPSSWLLRLVLFGGACYSGRLGALLLRALDPEDLADQMREIPPAFLTINTRQAPLLQALDVLSQMRAFGATDGGLCRPQLLVKSLESPSFTRGSSSGGGGEVSLSREQSCTDRRRRGSRLWDQTLALVGQLIPASFARAERSHERASGVEVTDPLHFARLKIRQAVNASDTAWQEVHQHQGGERRGSFGSEDEEIREFISSNFSVEHVEADKVDMRRNIGLLARRFSRATLASDDDGHGGVAILSDSPLDDRHRAHVHAILERAYSWDFNALELVEPTNNHSLLFLGYWLFVQEKLPSYFNIPHATLLNFLTQLEASYRDVPYHNRNHAADVLQASCYMLQSLKRGLLREASAAAAEAAAAGEAPPGGGDQPIRALEVLAVIIAAAAHDMDHTAQNNAFHILTGSELALRYNDRSVLESHHCCKLFTLLARPECNILANLSPAQRRQVRDLIVPMILGTDMAFHFQKVDKFKAMRAAGDLDCSKPEVKSFVLEMLLHCADVANPTRPQPTYRMWIGRVMEEFFQQGDLEKASGLPVTAFFCRATTNAPKCQVGFINIIVAPLVEAFAEFIDLPELTACLSANRAAMEKEAAATSEEAAAAAAAEAKETPAVEA